MASYELVNEINLRDFDYHGIILEDSDINRKGQYKVHIPELHTLINTTSGIWCRNEITNWKWNASHDHYYGSYFPLLPGTKVLVGFYENDFSTGYIKKIASDNVNKTTPKLSIGGIDPTPISERDEVYILYKTANKHNLFAIIENAEENGLSAVANSIHIYYNYRRTTIIINEDGLHISTKDNRGVTIDGQNNEFVGGDEKVSIGGDRDVFINGQSKNFSESEMHVFTNNEHRTYSKSTHSTQSSKNIAQDAPKIYLNCGKSKKAITAVTNKGENEVQTQVKLEMGIVPHLDKDNPDTYASDSVILDNDNMALGGVPKKGSPDKSLNDLEKGLEDDISDIGKQQVS